MKVQLGHGGDSMEPQSKINTQFCAYCTKRIWLFNFKEIQIQILERVLPTDATEEYRLSEEGKINY